MRTTNLFIGLRMSLVLLLATISLNVAAQELATVQELSLAYELEQARLAVQSVELAKKTDLAQSEYRLFELQYRKDAFQLQSFQTIIIFIVVIGLVVGGFVLAALQFRQDKQDPSVSSFEISRDGLKIQSSVIGLLVLTISMVFFFVYIRDVYKISELNSSAAQQQVTAPPAEE